MKKVLIGIGLATMALSTGFCTNVTSKSSCTADSYNKSCQLAVTKAEVKLLKDSNAEVKMRIKNSSDKTADIVAAYSPIDRETQLHHFVQNSKGQKVMKQIKNIEIYPHNSVALSFQELHVMLEGLNKKLQAGDKVPLVLILDDGSSISIDATVG
ncbi:copper chaperone PCu(A)C [Francisella sp. 19X1-34]|uniref:copper chaperone PCu(A)C n=1 Tax=Francisella sp. 19X1-34 TaxID=3087177 RepID=UPI002E348893|nr:copper chaperone PCu(A)C [Francisella sp. 19X1-34]MED7789124.1 copper chaperone PCu(A)C [Francisella sp. 19X1-34]